MNWGVLGWIRLVEMEWRGVVVRVVGRLVKRLEERYGWEGFSYGDMSGRLGRDVIVLAAEEPGTSLVVSRTEARLILGVVS